MQRPLLATLVLLSFLCLDLPASAAGPTLPAAERARLHRLVFDEPASTATVQSAERMAALLAALKTLPLDELPHVVFTPQQRARLRFQLPGGINLRNCQPFRVDYAWSEYLLNLHALQPELEAFQQASAALEEEEGCCGAAADGEALQREQATAAAELLAAFERLHGQQQRAALPPLTYAQYKVSLRQLQGLVAQARHVAAAADRPVADQPVEICFTGQTLVELVKYLRTRRCQLAPPLPGDEETYLVVYRWLIEVNRAHAKELDIVELPARTSVVQVRQSAKPIARPRLADRRPATPPHYQYRTVPRTSTYYYYRSVPSTRTYTTYYYR